MQQQLSTAESIYVEDEDRFVVMFAASYNVTDIADDTREAAHWALELTRDAQCRSTRWYVLDRETGIVTEYEQSDIESLEGS